MKNFIIFINIIIIIILFLFKKGFRSLYHYIFYPLVIFVFVLTETVVSMVNICMGYYLPVSFKII